MFSVEQYSAGQYWAADELARSRWATERHSQVSAALEARRQRAQARREARARRKARFVPAA